MEALSTGFPLRHPDIVGRGNCAQLLQVLGWPSTGVSVGFPARADAGCAQHYVRSKCPVRRYLARQSGSVDSPQLCVEKGAGWPDGQPILCREETPLWQSFRAILRQRIHGTLNRRLAQTRFILAGELPANECICAVLPRYSVFLRCLRQI